MVLLASLLVCGIDIQAAPIPGSPEGGNYVLSAPDLTRWTIGAYNQSRRRVIELYGIDTALETRRGVVYVGFDVHPSVTLYGAIMDGKHQTRYATKNSSDEFGAGVILNLIDHEILSPSLMEDVLRLNASFQYSKGKAGILSRLETFHEFYGALTLSLINEIEGSKLYWPHAIGLFIGPVYSHLEADSFEEKQAVGFNAGLDVYLAEHVTLNFGLEQFDSEDKYFIGLHLRL